MWMGWSWALWQQRKCCWQDSCQHCLHPAVALTCTHCASSSCQTWECHVGASTHVCTYSHADATAPVAARYLCRQCWALQCFTGLHINLPPCRHTPEDNMMNLRSARRHCRHRQHMCHWQCPPRATDSVKSSLFNKHNTCHLYANRADQHNKCRLQANRQRQQATSAGAACRIHLSVHTGRSPAAVTANGGWDLMAESRNMTPHALLQLSTVA